MSTNDDWNNQAQNQVIVAGGGVFVYDPVVAHGDLIASLTNLLTSPTGDTTEKGVAAYVVFGGDRFAVSLNQVGAGGIPGLSVIDLSSLPSSPAGVFATSSATSAAALLTSGEATGADVFASVAVHSQVDSGVTDGTCVIDAGEVDLGFTPTLIVDDNAGVATLHQALNATPAAPGNGASLYAQATSAPAAITTSGIDGSLPLAKIEISTHTAGNDGSAHDITAARTFPANDAATGTTYTIKALIRVNTGQTTAETLTIGADIDNGISGGGQLVPLATLGASFNGGALNTSYSIPAELVLIVNEQGAGTPGIYLSGPLGDESANRLATNSANMSGHSDTATWATNSAHTLAIYAQWGGAGGSAQNAHTTSSRRYREGP